TNVSGSSAVATGGRARQVSYTTAYCRSCCGAEIFCPVPAADSCNAANSVHGLLVCTTTSLLSGIMVEWLATPGEREHHQNSALPSDGHATETRSAHGASYCPAQNFAEAVLRIVCTLRRAIARLGSSVRMSS